LVAADAAFYSPKNETAAKAKGVKRVFIAAALDTSIATIERTRRQ
jgi:transcriptional regulator of met regulon